MRLGPAASADCHTANSDGLSIDQPSSANGSNSPLFCLEPPTRSAGAAVRSRSWATSCAASLGMHLVALRPHRQFGLILAKAGPCSCQILLLQQALELDHNRFVLQHPKARIESNDCFFVGASVGLRKQRAAGIIRRSRSVPGWHDPLRPTLPTKLLVDR